jgi:hypothetical protein
MLREANMRLNREDQPIPFDIIEENIRASFQMAASRNVIGVVFRKAL